MRYDDIKLDEDQLFELNMSPSNLRQLASQIEGAKAGLEFEMIVPDVQSDSDDNYDEPEMDFNADETIDGSRFSRHIQEFFLGGDGVNTRSQVNRAIDEAWDDYLSWLEDRWMSHFHEDFPEWFRERWRYDDSSRWLDAARDELGTDATDQEVADRANELFDHDYDEEMSNLGNVYDEYNDIYNDEERNEFEQDGNNVDAWLSDEGVYSMSTFGSQYDLSYPYYIYNNSNGGEYSFADVAEDFEQAIGRKVDVSGSYHGTTKSDVNYTLEPDGSLEPDQSEDVGLEFVSPPLTIEEMLADLKQVEAWAEGRGCYTNSSTGLHMNISVPNYSMDRLDFIKLALFLGDEYVSKEFGRLGAYYAKSAMEYIRKNIANNPANVAVAMDKMKVHLNTAASKLIHSGYTEKFTSINTKDNRVEFRSPGGDWLSLLSRDPGKIESTLLRMVVALDAACDETKYRKEYITKFYKLISPQADDGLSLFAQYAAGEMGKDQLKYAWANKVLSGQKKVATGPAAQAMAQKIAANPPKAWYRVEQIGGAAIIELVATSPENAISLARTEWRLPGAHWPDNKFRVRMLRPYQAQSEQQAQAQ